MTRIGVTEALDGVEDADVVVLGGGDVGGGLLQHLLDEDRRRRQHLRRGLCVECAMYVSYCVRYIRIICGGGAGAAGRPGAGGAEAGLGTDGPAGRSAGGRMGGAGGRGGARGTAWENLDFELEIGVGRYFWRHPLLSVREVGWYRYFCDLLT